MSNTTKTKKTMLNVKIDLELKREAKKLADSFGLSLSTIVSKQLKDFIENRRITFEERYTPNEKTMKLLEEMNAEIEKGDFSNFSGPFETAEEFIKELNS